MHSMCAPCVTQQMSRRYSHSHQTLSSMSCVMFPITRHTSNAFKVTMKLQTFLSQMVVTSCISDQYLWKYGFAKSSNNLYAPCILNHSEWFQGIASHFEIIPWLPSKGLKFGKVKLCPERINQWQCKGLEPVFSYSFKHKELSLIKVRYVMSD